MGYFSVTHIADKLETWGFVREDVYDACKFALNQGLIEADTLSVIELGWSDAVKSTASGWAHLRILSERVEYLYAVLPTTPIYDNDLCDLVFDRMKMENRYGELRLHQAVHLVEQFNRYLCAQKRALDEHPEYGKTTKCGARYVLEKVQAGLDHAQGKPRPAQQDVDDLDR